MRITRRNLLIASAASAAASLLASRAFAAPPPLEQKETYKVGFSQTESNNPWRLAQTKSMQDEAAARGWQLVYTDAAGSAAKQVADVNSMIAQGVDLIFLAPREEKPLIPAIMAAKGAGIPVILLDRNVDQSLAKPGEDYITFIGSDFVEEGRRIAEYLVGMAGDKKTIIQLEGTTGSSPANDRKRGFEEFLADHSDYQIVASQSGDFARDRGRQVAETLLQAHPDANVIYAHNDEMA
ncbi:MAG: sugar transporter substrate-binding protein, partial [Devosia sp.]|nr:sugar transporter substrate-binding protein [Devosia sp.]